MSFWYNEASLQLSNGNLDMSSTFNLHLIQSSATPSRTDVGAAAFLAANELTVSGYSSLSTTTTTQKDDTGSPQGTRIFWPATETWNNLGAGQTIGYALISRTSGDLMVLIWTLTPTATTGGDVQLTFDQTLGNALVRTTT